MLSSLAILAGRIRQRRRQLRLTQRDLAAVAGCTQSYISQFETGYRPVSPEIAQKLEGILKVPEGAFLQARFRRGRPPLSPAARQAVRAIVCASGSEPWRNRPSCRPRFRRPNLGRRIHNALWPRPRQLSRTSLQDISRLERVRSHDEVFWDHFNSVIFDSWPEKVLNVQVGLQARALAGISPDRLGCQLDVSCGKTGRPTGHRAFPAYILTHGDISIAWFPQRCVATHQGHRWPDNLLVAAQGNSKLTLVVEVDGPHPNHSAEPERVREMHLGVPVLHLRAQDVAHKHVLDQILGRVEQLLKPKTSIETRPPAKSYSRPELHE